MYKNIPPTPAKIHDDAECMLPSEMPMAMPIRHRMDERTLYKIACFTDMPALRSTAKSPAKGRTVVYSKAQELLHALNKMPSVARVIIRKEFNRRDHVLLKKEGETWRDRPVEGKEK